MKAVIDRKRYDTETATAVASWDNGGGPSDFNHCEETLYVTKNGAYFLHGEGGALSKYAQSLEAGRARCGGSAIVPMKPDEALDWLQAKQKVNAIEKYFPAAITDA